MEVVGTVNPDGSVQEEKRSSFGDAFGALRPGAGSARRPSLTRAPAADMAVYDKLVHYSQTAYAHLFAPV